MADNRILLISRNQNLLSLCKSALEEEKLPVHSISDCEEAMDHFSKGFTGIVILDSSTMETECPGLCMYVSESLNTPVIVVGENGTAGKKTKYLDLGIDGYIDQPLNPNVLVSQVKAIRQRNRIKFRPNIAEFASGGLHIDYHSKEVTLDGEKVELSKHEYGLLKELTLNAGKTLSYDHLLTAVWGSEYKGKKQHLYMYIGYLRKKIEADVHKPRYVITVTQVGYIFKPGE